MPASSSARRRMVAEIAATKRHHPDSPDLPRLRRDLQVESLAEQARKLVADWPPLTETELRHLAGILGLEFVPAASDAA